MTLRHFWFPTIYIFPPCIFFFPKFCWYNRRPYNLKNRLIRTNSEIPWRVELHEFNCITKTCIIACYSSNHSAILLALKLGESQRGRGSWKFNNSLLFEQDLLENRHNQEYLEFKQKLNDVFHGNVDWRYKTSVNITKKEKKSISFLNLEKNCAVQIKVRLLEVKGKEIKEQEKIIEHFYHIHEDLFSNDIPVSSKSISRYLKDINLSKLSMEQREQCECEFT